jgi:hypothetical protein
VAALCVLACFLAVWLTTCCPQWPAALTLHFIVPFPLSPDLPASAASLCCCSLDICGNPALNQPIPSQVTAAEGLKALRVTLPKHWTAEAGWEDMQAKLSSLRRLEVCCLSSHGAAGQALACGCACV